MNVVTDKDGNILQAATPETIRAIRHYGKLL
jgi:hypothetical protein